MKEEETKHQGTAPDLTHGFSTDHFLNLMDLLRFYDVRHLSSDLTSLDLDPSDYDTYTKDEDFLARYSNLSVLEQAWLLRRCLATGRISFEQVADYVSQLMSAACISERQKELDYADLEALSSLFVLNSFSKLSDQRKDQEVQVEEIWRNKLRDFVNTRGVGEFLNLLNHPIVDRLRINCNQDSVLQVIKEAPEVLREKTIVELKELAEKAGASFLRREIIFTSLKALIEKFRRGEIPLAFLQEELTKYLELIVIDPAISIVDYSSLFDGESPLAKKGRRRKVGKDNDLDEVFMKPFVGRRIEFLFNLIEKKGWVDFLHFVGALGDDELEIYNNYLIDADRFPAGKRGDILVLPRGKNLHSRLAIKFLETFSYRDIIDYWKTLSENEGEKILNPYERWILANMVAHRSLEENLELLREYTPPYYWKNIAKSEVLDLLASE